MTEQEKRWIEAWRIAGPELERIRDDELRSLDDARAIGLLGGSRSCRMRKDSWKDPPCGAFLARAKSEHVVQHEP